MHGCQASAATQAPASPYCSAPGLTSKASELMSPQGSSSATAFPKETFCGRTQHCYMRNSSDSKVIRQETGRESNGKAQPWKGSWSGDCSAAMLSLLVHL